MKRITVVQKRYGGTPAAAYVSRSLAKRTVELIGGDMAVYDVPVLDADDRDGLRGDAFEDLDAEGGETDGV